MLRTAKGEPIALGAEIARGGEGTIHDVQGRPDLVAKIYTKPPGQERVDKLAAMVAGPAVPACAWPCDPLHDASGCVVGFLMPKITGRKEIHVLCNNAARRAKFPDRGYDFLVAVAANLARAVANLHEAGHVIGDINERFALVAPDATVVLIDCDSFQIEDPGRVYPCDVGRPEFQPPELQGLDLRGRKRTRNHDAFGLAVLIFQLLFLGRHPFAGRPVGADMPSLEDAIRRYLFAYDSTAQPVLEPPPNTLRLEHVAPTVAMFFRRAFGREGQHDGRPKAAAWVRELDLMRAQLRRCSANPRHGHLGAQCPICAIEGAAGAVLFLPPVGWTFDFITPATALWGEIAAIDLPPPGDPPRPEQFAVAGGTVRLGPNWKRIALVGVGVPLLLFALIIAAAMVPEATAPILIVGLPLSTLLLALDVKHPYVTQRSRALARARAVYEKLLSDWETGRPQRPFHQEKERLAKLHARLVETLPRKRAAELAQLQAKARADALQRFLEGIELRPGAVKGIGPTRVKTLNSFGIETAADITPGNLAKVPGFGRKFTGELLAWRRRQEGAFSPPPRLAPNRIALAQVEAAIAREARPLLAELESGKTWLHTLADRAREEIAQLRRELEQAAKAVAQARADLDAVKRGR